MRKVYLTTEAIILVPVKVKYNSIILTEDNLSVDEFTQGIVSGNPHPNVTILDSNVETVTLKDDNRDIISSDPDVINNAWADYLSEATLSVFSVTHNITDSK